MKKHLLTAVLIVGFVGPALGADYYVALKVGGGTLCDHGPQTRSQIQKHGLIFLKEHGEKGHV
jgi:hypothetical protein